MEVVEDPESDSSTLLVQVQLDSDATSALALLASFDAGWWRAHRKQFGDHVCVDVKCI
jgi:hypothetical protein